MRIAFDIGSDPDHQLNRIDRILAGGGFGRQHDGIGAIKNGIGNIIGGFSPGRARICDHAFQHLGRSNYRLAGRVTFADDALLDQRHLFRLYFNAEVTAGNHDAIGHRQDRIEIIDRFRFFDFGDNPDALLRF